MLHFHLSYLHITHVVPSLHQTKDFFTMLYLDNQQNLRENIKLATASAILQIASGYKLKDNDNPYLVLALPAVRLLWKLKGTSVFENSL